MDRLVIADKIRSRLTDSVELALRRGEGLLMALIQDAGNQWTEKICSEKNACAHCGISFEALTARNFSFNSPYGACPTCLGLGTMLVFDEDLIVPDPDLPLDDGAIRAWKGGGRRPRSTTRDCCAPLRGTMHIDMDTPYHDLPESFRKVLLYGSGEEEVEFGFWRGGAYHKYSKPFEGVIPNLQRRYEQTDSDYMRQKLTGFMSRQPCTDCHGARLRPESLACTVGGKSIVDVTRMSITQAVDFLNRLDLTAQERQIAQEVLKEIRQRLRFLVNVGLDYLTLDRESGTLSGGEAQRIRLATQIGAGLVGVLYVLDEPSIGLHQRDNREADPDAEGPARPRQHGGRGRARRADDPRGGLRDRPRAGRGPPRRRGGVRRAGAASC